MKEINYKLIVSDFDGTLLDDNHKIPETVQTAVKEYVSAGGIFAVCTGRMLKSILPRVRELGLSGLVVAYQGTVIAEIESGKIIKYGGISCSEAAEICKELERLNRNINVYSDENLYTSVPEDDEQLKLYEEITGVKAPHIDGKMSDFVLRLGKSCQKIACLVSPRERMKLYEELKATFGRRFDVTCSAAVLVEISPLGDNKGVALEYIANRYGINIDSTVAVGDNLNDLSMIEKAAVGVAVGNAVEELANAADFVAVSNNDGAVAQIIEKFGFK